LQPGTAQADGGRGEDLPGQGPPYAVTIHAITGMPGCAARMAASSAAACRCQRARWPCVIQPPVTRSPPGRSAGFLQRRPRVLGRQMFPYMADVVVTDAWPRSLETTSIGTPSQKLVAAECRNQRESKSRPVLADSRSTR
jgi:hypothetical protein